MIDDPKSFYISLTVSYHKWTAPDNVHPGTLHPSQVVSDGSGSGKRDSAAQAT